jgi:hypothetical protein
METQTVTNIPPVASPPQILVTIVGAVVKASDEPVDLTEQSRIDLHAALDVFLNTSLRPTSDNIFCVNII